VNLLCECVQKTPFFHNTPRQHMTSKRKCVEEKEEDLKRARPNYLRFEHEGKTLSVRFDTRYLCLEGQDFTDIPPQLEQLPYAECIRMKGDVRTNFRMPVWAVLKFKYIECNCDGLVPVQWDPRIYTRLTIQGRKTVFTTLCIRRFGPLRILPVEVVHLIFGHLPLYIEACPQPTRRVNKVVETSTGPIVCTESNPSLKPGRGICSICMQLYICIDHKMMEPIDDEVCQYVTGICGHSFHRCCIERWCRIRQVCPLCLAYWQPSV